MKYAAFFRNLNLGRANSPTRLQFEAAFFEAGAVSAASFLTNGTMVFEPKPTTRPRQLLASACQSLRKSCGLKEPAFLRRVDYLAELVAADPFAAVDPASVYERCVSFLHHDATALPGLPRVSNRGDVEFLRFTDTEALSLSHKIGNTPGSPNAFLEKRLGLPATTRSWSTVCRLVQKHG